MTYGDVQGRPYGIMANAAAGRGSRDIANELFISPKTVSVHVSNILGKLGATSGGEAAAKAHVLRLLDSMQLGFRPLWWPPGGRCGPDDGWP